MVAESSLETLNKNMGVEIELPNESTVMLFKDSWYCPDRRTHLVMEYFSKSLPAQTEGNREEALARHVVAQIPGAKITHVDENMVNFFSPEDNYWAEKEEAEE